VSTAMSIDEIARTLARFERQRSVISGALIGEDVRARLLAQHDSAVALFASSLDSSKAGDGGGTPQVPSALKKGA